MAIKFTATAREQFLDAVRYFRDYDLASAKRFKAACDKRLKLLESLPRLGRRVPEFQDLPYREVYIEPYRFFYRPVGDVVWIVAVWHTRQLPSQPEGPQGDDSSGAADEE